jgi:thiol-disulfide isomerase/thioredoxin
MNSMRIRWTIAVIAALALALLTLNVSWHWPFGEARSTSAPATTAACPANAKTANLDFTLKDLNGSNIKLSDFKGKVILLDFWATWCGPCKIEIPWFVEFQAKYGARGLQVVGVSIDDTVDKLNPFVREFKMNYPVLQGLGHDDITNAYGPIWGIPVTAVISRDGKLCSKHTGLGSKTKFEDEINALL